MVDLRAANPALGVRKAAAIAAKGMRGTLATHTERLRGKYRRLKKAGRLPGARGAAEADARLRKLREMYGKLDADLEAKRQELAAAEEEAASIGLDLSAPKLRALVMDLESALKHLEFLTVSEFGTALWLRAQGINDPEEASAIFSRALQERQEVERKLRVLRACVWLRDYLGLPVP